MEEAAMSDFGIAFANPEYTPLLFVWVFVVGLFIFNAAWRRKTLKKLQVMNWPDAFDAPKARPYKNVMQIVGFLFLVLAMMGPQWGQKEKTVKAQGLDVCMAIDLSRSMLAEDVQPNRLQAAKNQLTIFMNRMGGDRAALVGFAGSAFVAAPLTTDHHAIVSFMDPMSSSYISDHSTNLAVGVDACLTALGLEDVKDRVEIEDLAAKVIVLISDGEETGDDFRGAIGRSAKLGVPIYSFAVGTAKGGLIPIRSERGVEYLKDPENAGANVITKLEEKKLKEIAEKSGGKVFYLVNGIEAWKEFEDALQNYKRDSVDSGTRLDREDRFQWPLWVAFLLLLLDFLLPETGWAFRRSSSLKNIVLILIGFLGLSSRPSYAAAQEVDSDLNPLTIYKNNKGVKLYKNRNNPEARHQFEEALADKSNNVLLRFNWAANRLVMSFPQVDESAPKGAGAAPDPKQFNQKIIEESLGELTKIYENYVPTSSEDGFYKALNYQMGLVNEIKQAAPEAMKHYYASLGLKPANKELDELATEAIKRLLVSQSSGGGGGGGGGGGESNPEDEKSDGEGEGDKKEQNPKYGQGQQKPKFSGTDINEQQAKKILESVQSKEQEVQKRKAQKDAKEKGSRGNEQGQSFGRGKQW